jgi:hypothetical protein
VISTSSHAILIVVVVIWRAKTDEQHGGTHLRKKLLRIKMGDVSYLTTEDLVPPSDPDEDCEVVFAIISGSS